MVSGRSWPGGVTLEPSEAAGADVLEGWLVLGVAVGTGKGAAPELPLRAVDVFSGTVVC